MSLEPLRFRPEPASPRRDLPVAPGNLFLRAITARVIASLRHERVEIVAAEEWPNDRTLAQVVRAVSAPALMTTTGWAAELVRRLVADGLEAMGPAYAGPQVLKAALMLSLDGAGSISVPGFVAAAGNAGFVAEGQPIPVRQLAAAAALLTPFKIGAISVLTREMVESSNAEALIGDTLGRSAGAAIDAALFDSNAATAARPAGLRNGIAALTASNSTDLWEAAFEDITTLINSLAPVGGNGPYILVASPGRAVNASLRFQANQQLQMFGSSAVGNDLLAIAPAALVAALSPEPTIETSGMATMHMDTVPAPIVSTAGVAAAEARSLFQTDSIAVKIRWPITWALRDTRGIAWLTPAWK